MKCTFTEIFVYNNSLKCVANKTLPRKVAVAIARNIGIIEKEINFFESQKKEIAERYAKRDENGKCVIDDGAYVFEDDAIKLEALEEIVQLKSTEIDVDLMKFNAVELERCDTVDRYDILTPAEEVAVSWMIDYEGS